MASNSPVNHSGYRGRLAPSPTGYLHVGHARTFWMAYQRAREAGGTLVMRMEDLDPDRCRSMYAEAAVEDLRWLGIRWQEGPDKGGPFAPYLQPPSRCVSGRVAQAGAGRLPVPLPLFTQGSGERAGRTA
jgi:glutamyl-tRNA synthetase